jgi:hypothetical protein
MSNFFVALSFLPNLSIKMGGTDAAQNVEFILQAQQLSCSRWKIRLCRLGFLEAPKGMIPTGTRYRWVIRRIVKGSQGSMLYDLERKI